MYINFLDATTRTALRAAYGEDTYRRLRTIKAPYDPDDIFRGNHNIAPADRDEEHAGAALTSPRKSS